MVFFKKSRRVGLADFTGGGFFDHGIKTEPPNTSFAVKYEKTLKSEGNILTKCVSGRVSMFILYHHPCISRH